MRGLPTGSRAPASPHASHRGPRASDHPRPPGAPETIREREREIADLRNSSSCAMRSSSSMRSSSVYDSKKQHRKCQNTVIPSACIYKAVPGPYILVPAHSLSSSHLAPSIFKPSDLTKRRALTILLN